MNINYGDKSIITKYIQYYLRDNYLKPMRITGYYDTYTHERLLKYLDSANHSTQSEIINAIKNIVCPEYLRYVEQIRNGEEDAVEYLEHPIDYMEYHIDKRVVSYYLKETHPKYELILRSLIFEGYREEFKRVCEDNGWYIIEYPDYALDISVIDQTDVYDKLAINIVIGMKPYTDNFPHRDARYMVNYFNNRFIDNISIGGSIHEKNSDYRVAMVPMEHGDTFIFTHRYRYSIDVKIAFCEMSIDELEVYFNTTANPTLSRIHIYDKYSDGSVAYKEASKKIIPGRPLIIDTSSANYKDCKTLLIQVPSIKMSTSDTDKSIISIDRNIRVGDINNDGVIDEIDLLLYYIINNPNEYFCRDYQRIIELINCINKRYELYDSRNDRNMLDSCNGSGQRYGRGIPAERYDPEFDIDYIVEEIMYLSRGSDISCQRYIVDSVIKYRFMCSGIQSKTCIELINSWVDNSNNRLVNYASFHEYISGEYSQNNSILSNYISIDSNGNYEAKSNRSDCKMFMEQRRENLSNTILVIRANHSDGIEHVDNIILNRLTASDEHDTLTIPIDDYVDNPWMVHEKFIPMITDMTISKYSEPDYIKYVHDLIDSDILNENKGTIGNDFEYSEKLRSYIKRVQIDNKITFSTGYLDPETNDFLYTSAFESYINLRRSEVY